MGDYLAGLVQAVVALSRAAAGRSKLRVIQRGSNVTNTVFTTDGGGTAYMMEVAIINDSPSPVVIRGFDLKLPGTIRNSTGSMTQTRLLTRRPFTACPVQSSNTRGQW